MSPTESQPLMEQSASSPVSFAAFVCTPVPLSKKYSSTERNTSYTVSV